MIQVLPSSKIHLQQSSASTTSDECGMREMLARALHMRGVQYLLIKSPSAPGKSRGQMLIAIEKLSKIYVEMTGKVT